MALRNEQLIFKYFYSLVVIVFDYVYGVIKPAGIELSGQKSKNNLYKKCQCFNESEFVEIIKLFQEPFLLQDINLVRLVFIDDVAF
jgi:hypothetical protein